MPVVLGEPVITCTSGTHWGAAPGSEVGAGEGKDSGLCFPEWRRPLLRSSLSALSLYAGKTQPFRAVPRSGRREQGALPSSPGVAAQGALPAAVGVRTSTCLVSLAESLL